MYIAVGNVCLSGTLTEVAAYLPELQIFKSVCMCVVWCLCVCVCVCVF